MLNPIKPLIGTWYLHRDKGQMFQVVNVDEHDHAIELQHFDGDLEEIEFSEWRTLRLEPAAMPEDWTGPVDEIEQEDLGYSETGMEPRDWLRPLAELEWDETSFDLPELPPEDEELLPALLH